MSRRKQARPSRANFEEDPLLGSRNNPLTTNDDQQPSTPQDENDTGSENEDTHVTGEEAVDLTSNRSSHHEEDDDEREASESPMDEDEEDDNNIDNIKNDAHNDPIDDDENSKKQIENLQDAENNNDGIFSLASGHTSHVTLEALQNTKVAVAQFAAKALAGCVDDSAKREFELVKSTLQELQDQQSRQIQLIDHLQQQLSITHKQSGDNIKEEGSDLTSVLSSPLGFLYPKSISSLTLNPLTIPSSLLLPTTITSPPTPSTTPTTTTMATNTLSSIGTAIPSSASVAATLAATIASRPLLHHHNMMTSSSCSTTSTSPVTVISAPSFTSHHDDSRSNSLSPVSLVLPTSTTTTTSAATTPISSSSSSSIIDTTAAVPTITTHNNNNNNPSNMLPSHPGLASISSSLASTIITNNDPLPLNEPNTLEMLQKRAQEVLDNASQGLLANNLADELAFRSGKSGSRLSPYDSKSSGGRGEPFFKHRCRYCGKVFGSDSALQIHIRSHTVRGNTTCNICYKTFACNSALEIHYRSHTKERPFKCTICDRGFSTKGNMKQHMLTHKIRDLPSHMYGDSKQVGSSPQSGNQEQQQQQRSQELRDQRHHQDRESSHSPMEPDESSLPPPPPPPPLPPSASAPAVTQPSLPLPLPPPSSPMTPSSLHEQPMPIKRSPTEGDLPAPKRPSMSSKHLCHVCNKNFSSSSALQIHMRTHTGDKPFRCTVCQKAFTTKGNLKVHMGTHMWTNGASRRGRRMSLDLPPLPITPKDSEFLQRRPDLFYPYLPGPGFLNGVQQKLSEISVIQGNNGLPVNHPAAGKYAGLFGSLYGGGGGLNLSVGNGFPMDKGPLVPSNNSHDDGKPLVPSGSMLFHTPSPSHSPSTPSSNTGNQNSASIPPWNNETLQHHFERDGPSRDNDNESTSPPAPRLPPTSTTRGEGLAA